MVQYVGKIGIPLGFRFFCAHTLIGTGGGFLIGVQSIKKYEQLEGTID